MLYGLAFIVVLFHLIPYQFFTMIKQVENCFTNFYIIRITYKPQLQQTPRSIDFSFCPRAISHSNFLALALSTAKDCLLFLLGPAFDLKVKGSAS